MSRGQQDKDGSQDRSQQSRTESVRRGLGAAAQVAHVLRDRDDYVARGLAFLGEAGILDVATQKRLWELYQEGDQATRRLVQEQVARVTGTEGEGGGPAPKQSAQGTPSSSKQVDPLEVEILRQLSSPHVDVEAVARHVKRFDPMRFLGEAKDPGPVLRFLAEAPLAVHRTKQRLLYSGVSLLAFVVILVATVVLFPAIVPWVGLAGVVMLALFFGVHLLRSALWIDRSSKRQGIDLDVYAQLPEDERRILLIRRLGLRMLDPLEKDRKPARPQGPSGSPPAATPATPPAENAPTDVQASEAAMKANGSERDEKPPEPAAPARLVPEPVEPEASADPPMDAASEDPLAEQSVQESGKLGRFVSRAQDAWRRAADSQTAHKVGEESRRASKEVARRAQDAGQATRKRLSELKKRGEEELERRRALKSETPRAPTKKSSAAKRSAAKKKPRKQVAKKTGGVKKAARKGASSPPRKRPSGAKKAARKGSAKRSSGPPSKKRAGSR
jgi:hypothetical protein